MSNTTRTQHLVYDQAGGEAGMATGAVHRCRMEGCRGERVSVRWPDGHFTYPCSRGLVLRTDGARQIG
ncbi:hypothetical protein HKW90_03945 [Pseudomonas aeruginosa]|uniref:hypothetical protein n=1 Tax=Pseudomonas nitroreducens TaxID=46680 RepID=UPI00351D7DD9|nr:hypothetical protein [Pseudomonas aeruginosa]